MSDERRIVLVNGVSDQRRVVIDDGEKRISVRGSDRKTVVYVRGGTGGGGSGNATSLQGYNLSITSPQDGDVLSFSSGGVVNRRQIELTDGGNF